MATPIVEAARKRALAANKPAPLKTSSKSSDQKGEFILRPDGSRVPIQYFDLSDEQKANFDALLSSEKEAEAHESLALKYSMALGDQLSTDAKRITRLEKLVESLVGENMELRSRQDGIDLNVETVKSDELVEQESQAAQTVVNMAAITSDGNALILRLERAKEDFNREFESRLAELEQPIAELVGRVESAGSLYQEGILANQSRLEEVTSSTALLKVQVTELTNQADAMRNAR